jgi:exopolyphosphatase/guanosine-5'-triphosphate,3'-diphosphate pyrophosphatase
MKTAAFIDIGTNSARLLVVQIQPGGSYKVLSRIKETVRLGEGQYPSGRIQPEAAERLSRVCTRFAGLARSLGASEITAMATSSLREGTNAQELVERIADEAGFEIQIISGKEEARLIHLGVAAGLHLGEEQALFIDIGGGSTELIVGGQYGYAILESMKLGAIRITGQCLGQGFTGTVSQKRQERMRSHVKTVALPSLKRISAYVFLKTVGSSGTIVSLAGIADALYHSGKDSGRLSLADLKKLFPYLCSLTLEERKKVPGMNPERADIILAGACILEVIMETLDIRKLEISDRGLREGILMDYLAGIPGTPQSEQMPVREASVRQLGRYCLLEEDHAAEVLRLALSLFDSAKEAGLHNYGEKERELLAYAAWLHDVGDFLSFVGHHQHGEYIILHADLLGFDQREILILSRIARYHRKKLPGKKDTEFQGLKNEDRDRIRILASFLRIAELLSRGHVNAVAGAVLRSSKKDVKLKVTPAEGADLTLEIMSLGKEAQVFAKVFGKKLILPEITCT